MINVYDWFESFKTVLETQVKKVKSGRGTPKKQKGRGKGKGKQKAVESEPGEGEDGEEEEKWKLEVQARFMRAMQELDYLGFVKHTGRKADHVLRLVFDVDD
jgi:origin recognition complex subunit 3